MNKIQATLFPEGYFLYENHHMNLRRRSFENWNMKTLNGSMKTVTLSALNADPAMGL